VLVVGIGLVHANAQPLGYLSHNLVIDQLPVEALCKPSSDLSTAAAIEVG
jgi:hypothetical protein